MKFAKLSCVVLCISLVLSATAFSGHYKKKPPANCTSIDPGDFVYPAITILKPQVGDSCRSIPSAEVWVQCILDMEGKATKSNVVWCSVDDPTFEVTALEVVKAKQFDKNWRGYHGQGGKLYHLVLFRQQEEHECEIHWRRPGPEEYVEVTEQPEMVESSPPAYPRMALDGMSTGSVWVKVLVSPTGVVDEAKIDKSSGDKYLDNSAVLAAYRYKFIPAKMKGKPVATWIKYRVDFKITN